MAHVAKMVKSCASSVNRAIAPLQYPSICAISTSKRVPTLVKSPYISRKSDITLGTYAERTLQASSRNRTPDVAARAFYVRHDGAMIAT